MRQIPFVLPDEAALARYMETKLINAPPEAGILFAGVSVEVSLPKPGARQVIFNVWVGMSRSLEEETAGPIVQSVLKDEVAQGTAMKIHAHRGQARTTLLTSP